MEIYNSRNKFTCSTTTSEIAQGVDTQYAPLNMFSTLESIRAWLQQDGNTLSKEAWQWKPSLDKSLDSLNQNYLTYGDLIQYLLNRKDKPLKIHISDDPNTITQKVAQWDREANRYGVYSDNTQFTPDREGMKKASTGNHSLYSLVYLNILQPWENIPMEKENTSFGQVLQINKNNTNTKMGQDKYGYYWGSYTSILSDNKPITVRITYIKDTEDTEANNDRKQKPSLYELLDAHSNTSSLEFYKKQGFLDSILGKNKPNSIANIKGFRFHSTNIPIYNQSMSSILGCANQEWFVAGSQVGGQLQINSNISLNLKVKSVCVTTTRSCPPPLNNDGYMDFFEVEGSDWRKTYSFKCLYEVIVDDKLVFATFGTDKHIKN